VEDAKANAERAAIRLKTNFPKWDISTEGTSGSPAWELIFKAEQWKPGLIVLGSQGRSALGRFVLGSVSQKVLAEAACSVRVARGRVEEPSPVRIIVGIDGSAGAEAAVRAVAARNWPAQSEAKVVIVDDPIEPTVVGAMIPGVSQSLADGNLEYRKQITVMVEDAAKRVNSGNLKATGIVEQGNPKRVIVKLAEEWGANCIFVGSTGFSSRLERFLIGSVASAIASRAHCSVEVVREPKKG
jgi:nucleotide-binding universal stress UspA family protein